jgi:hypothetical protein
VRTKSGWFTHTKMLAKPSLYLLSRNNADHDFWYQQQHGTSRCRYDRVCLKSAGLPLSLTSVRLEVGFEKNADIFFGFSARAGSDR